MLYAVECISLYLMATSAEFSKQANLQICKEQFVNMCYSVMYRPYSKII